MAEKKTKAKSSKAMQKNVTRYTYENIKETRTPETGHTSLLPSDEQVVTLPMDNGWSKALKIGQISEDERSVVLDMDPTVDPVLFWAGKRNKCEVPVLPLQRNEVVSESRIAQIIDRAKQAAENKSGASRQGHLYADLEKSLRESERTKRVQFYTHDEGWKNKLICGDSLHLMESLLHYESLRASVQMIYFNPPYGIRYDSNFQQRVDSTKNDEKSKADDVLTIKAYRDTWGLGVHSYLSYLIARLYLCRELLSESGSVFVQINQENLHLVKALLAEVFGAANEVAIISFTKTSGFSGSLLSSVCDYLVWFAKSKPSIKYRQLYSEKNAGGEGASKYRPLSTIAGAPKDGFDQARLATSDQLTSQGETSTDQEFEFQGKIWRPPKGLHWKTTVDGLKQLARKDASSSRAIVYVICVSWTIFLSFPLAMFGVTWEASRAELRANCMLYKRLPRWFKGVYR